MKLISCEECAVVLDEDRLLFPSRVNEYKDDGTLDDDKFVLEGDDYLPFVNCPICNSVITKDDRDDNA